MTPSVSQTRDFHLKGGSVAEIANSGNGAAKFNYLQA